MADNADFTHAQVIALVKTEEGKSEKAILEGITPANWHTRYDFRAVVAEGNAISHTLSYRVSAYGADMATDSAVAPVADAILALYESVAAMGGGASQIQ